MKRRVVLIGLLALFAIIVVGAGWVFLLSSRSPTFPLTSNLLTSEESRVRDYILKTVEHPSSVTFLKWGPHAKAGEWYLDQSPKPHRHPVYRVVFREQSRGEVKTRDWLVIVGVPGVNLPGSDTVLIDRENFLGDNWVRARELGDFIKNSKR